MRLILLGALRILLAALLIQPSAGFADDAPPTIGAIRANPGGALNAAGMSQLLGTPYRQPTVNDDITKGIYPSMLWRANGTSFVNISNGQNNAVWQKVTQFPKPLDTLGYFVDNIATNAGGTGYAIADKIGLAGGVTGRVNSVVGGVITDSAFTGYIVPFVTAYGTLTVTAITTGKIGPGTIVAGAGIAAPAAGLPYGTYVMTQISGTLGGVGVYTVNLGQTVASSGSPEAMTGSAIGLFPLGTSYMRGSTFLPSFATGGIATDGTMTISTATTIYLDVGATVTGPGVPTNAVITAVVAATYNNTGTYTVLPAPAVAVPGGTLLSIGSTTTQQMFGACAPTTTAAPVLTTTGAGTGATFNLTMLYAWGWADGRQMTNCYSSNLVQVQNSVSAAVKDVGFVGNGALDAGTALSFGQGNQQMETYANYNDGSVPGLSILYDQGPNGANATQATIAQQGVLYGPRTFGNSPALTFNSQGAASAGQPWPSVTKMTIPSSVALNSTFSAMFWGGGAINFAAGMVALTPVGGSATKFYQINDSGTGLACNNQNNTGTSGSGGFVAPVSTESASVVGCIWNNGDLYVDSTYSPAPAVTLAAGSFVAGTTVSTVTIRAGNGCPVATDTAVTVSSAVTDTVTTHMAAMVAAINASPALRAYGITAAVPVSSNTFAITLYQPVGQNCVINSTATGGSLNLTTASSAAGWPMAGGSIGLQPVTANTGYDYTGFVVIVPWAPTIAQAQQFRQSVHHWFDLDGHIGGVINTYCASNCSGYQAPFLQDPFADLGNTLGRNDIVVVNKSGAGLSLVTFAANMTTDQKLFYPLKFLTSGKPSNNICVIESEVNSLTSAGTNVAEYAAIQTIAGACHAAGWSVLCSTGYNANFTAIPTATAEMALLAASIRGNPGACDKVVDPMAVGVFSSTTGPWTFPFFTKTAANGNHPAPAGSALHGSILSEALRQMIQ